MKSEERAGERQLDWLLGEVEGGVVAPDLTGRMDQLVQPRRPHRNGRAIAAAAALVVLGTGVLVGVAASRSTDEGTDSSARQDPIPERPVLEVRSVAEVEALPLDTRAVKCFDFADDELASLSRLQRLELLDLSGMDVNSKGYSVALSITDAGIAAIGRLPALRELVLDGCHEVTGASLATVAPPSLEVLSAHYCAIDEAGIRVIAAFADLRALDLSGNFAFPSSSLEAIGGLRKLRRLAFGNCYQLRGADLEYLADLKVLEELELHGCSGRFRGSVLGELPQAGDGVGVDDHGLRSLAALPALRTLGLASCPNYTDAGLTPFVLAVATGERSLRRLNLAGNRSITAKSLAFLPENMESLSLRGCDRVDLNQWLDLVNVKFRRLADIDLSELDVRASQIQTILESPRRRLVLSACEKLGPAVLEALVRHPSLEELHLSRSAWLHDVHLSQFAESGSLHTLVLERNPQLTDAGLEGLAYRGLTHLDLNWCENITDDGLRHLQKHRLKRLALYRTGATSDFVERIGSQWWPGCEVVMPDARRWRAPQPK